MKTYISTTSLDGKLYPVKIVVTLQNEWKTAWEVLRCCPNTADLKAMAVSRYRYDTAGVMLPQPLEPDKAREAFGNLLRQQSRWLDEASLTRLRFLNPETDHLEIFDTLSGMEAK